MIITAVSKRQYSTELLNIECAKYKRWAFHSSFYLLFLYNQSKRLVHRLVLNICVIQLSNMITIILKHYLKDIVQTINSIMSKDDVFILYRYMYKHYFWWSYLCHESKFWNKMYGALFGINQTIVYSCMLYEVIITDVYTYVCTVQIYCPGLHIDRRCYLFILSAIIISL